MSFRRASSGITQIAAALVVVIALCANARAQTAVTPPLVVPQGYDTLSIPPPPPAAPRAPLATSTAPTNDSAQGPRVRAEILGGVLGSVLGTGLGVGIIFLSVAPCISESSPDDCTPGLVIGSIFGSTAMMLGAPLGVYLAGNSQGGNGALGYAVLGEFAGAALGAIPAGLFAAIGQSNDTEGWVVAGFVVAYVSSICGTILGYELSSTPREAAPAPSLELTPTLAPTAARDGLIWGLAGRF